jgi:hypothetical protein
MIRTLILSTAACVFAAGVAFADDVMASRFGNTVEATNAKGEVTKLWYAEDGSFTGNANGQDFKGTWELKDGTICLTQTDPAPQPGATNPTCNPASAHAVGDTWEVGEGDAKMTIKLVAGKQ